MLQKFCEKHKIKPQKIAVGVSGGADSLYAVLKTQEELSKLGFKVIALTVDHGLRATSEKEANFVHKLMKVYDIEHHILAWQGKKPKNGMEEAARLARYDLLENWCVAHDVHYLITAHHLLDQAETFFMRLQRGSGLDGLCGMKELTPLKSICILRPFLKENPENFKTYLKKSKISWVEDESNSDENLLRVKMRHFLPLLEQKTGITPEKIVQTMECLQGTRAYFERKIKSIIENNFKHPDEKVFCCAQAFFCESDAEIQYRLLCFLLKNIANLCYAPEADKVLGLLEKLKKEHFKSATLGHCHVIKQNGFIWFLPEIREFKPCSKELWKKYMCAHLIDRKIKFPAAVKRFLTQNYNENHI